MAARRSYVYLGGGNAITQATNSDSPFEFDESDVWNSNYDPFPTEPRRPIPSSRPSLKKPAKKSTSSTNSRANQTPPAAAKSLPVNVPDWSKILRGEFKDRSRENEDDVIGSGGDEEDDDGDDDERMPPHEYLARTRIASFSVHEGIGRTLKGRDLSRVRNAIWKQTGFED